MSHYSGKYGGRDYYSRGGRDSEARGSGRERGREWRRNERDRSRSSSRDRDRGKKRERSLSRESRFRDRDRRDKSEERVPRYAKGRFGGKSTGRFSDRSSPVPSTSSLGFPEIAPSSLIREKDLNAAKLMASHYGSFNYNSSRGPYPFPDAVPVAREPRQKEKDRKNDPLFKAAVETIVMNIKTKGDYDQIRKDCFSDIDTKAAYLNLHGRIKTTVDKYLNLQTYKKDMDKVKTREGMRKKILDTPYFEKGIESVVSQILTPKIASLIQPKIEEEVYKFLNKQKEGGNREPSPEPPPVVKEEQEMKFQHTISTKEISFHDITSAVRERKVRSSPPLVKRKSDKLEEDDSSKSDASIRDNEDMDIDSSSEEEIVTPMYSPAGKTPMADDDSSRQSEDESKGSLQIDEFAAVQSEEMEESTGMSEQLARTPMPEESSSPYVPADGSESASIPLPPSRTPPYPGNEAEIGAQQPPEFIPTPSSNFSQPHLHQTSQILSSAADHPPILVPPPLPPLPAAENILHIPTPPPHSPPRTHVHIPPPPPVCDDAACSSPPVHDMQRTELLPVSSVKPEEAEDNDTEEPLPPGEEPEGYFAQMRQTLYSHSQKEDEKPYPSNVDKPPSPIAPEDIPLPPKEEPETGSNEHQDEAFENMDDEEEEVEDDSDEESPMFEKVKEVSPPRPVELLHDSELVQELTKEILGQAASRSNDMFPKPTTYEPSFTPPPPPTEKALEDDGKGHDATPSVQEDEPKMPEECKYLESLSADYDHKLSYYKRILGRLDLPKEAEQEQKPTDDEVK